MIFRGLYDFAHTVFRPDIARVDPKARRTVFGGFNCAFIMEMNISNDRYRYLLHNLFQRRRGFLIRARYPYDIRPHGLQRMNLRHSRRHIMRDGIGHGLHRNRRIPPHRHVPHPNLTGRTAVNLSPRAMGCVICCHDVYYMAGLGAIFKLCFNFSASNETLRITCPVFPRSGKACPSTLICNPPAFPRVMVRSFFPTGIQYSSPTARAREKTVTFLESLISSQTLSIAFKTTWLVAGAFPRNSVKEDAVLLTGAIGLGSTFSGFDSNVVWVIKSFGTVGICS